MLLPTVMLKSMLMRISQKVGIGLVFGLVLIDILFDILRTVYTASLNFANFPDQNTLWALLEPTIAVIVCALPCYRGFLSRKPTGPLVSRSIGSLSIWSYFGTVRSHSVDEKKAVAKTEQLSV